MSYWKPCLACGYDCASFQVCFDGGGVENLCVWCCLWLRYVVEKENEEIL
jgi:hypothetical protein